MGLLLNDLKGRCYVIFCFSLLQLNVGVVLAWLSGTVISHVAVVSRQLGLRKGHSCGREPEVIKAITEFYSSHLEFFISIAFRRSLILQREVSHLPILPWNFFALFHNEYLYYSCQSCTEFLIQQIFALCVCVRFGEKNLLERP